MDSRLRKEIDQLHAQVCRGLADTNRILILYALGDHDHNVGELAEALGLPQPTVSRHLKTLRECGLVLARRNGQLVSYALADRRIIQALDLLRGVLSSKLEGQASLARHARQKQIP